PAEVDRPSGDEQRCTVVDTSDILGLVQPDSPPDLSSAGVFLSVEALRALSTDHRNTRLVVRVVRVRSRNGDVGVSIDQRPEVHQRGLNIEVVDLPPVLSLLIGARLAAQTEPLVV